MVGHPTGQTNGGSEIGRFNCIALTWVATLVLYPASGYFGYRALFLSAASSDIGVDAGDETCFMSCGSPLCVAVETLIV